MLDWRRQSQSLTRRFRVNSHRNIAARSGSARLILVAQLVTPPLADYVEWVVKRELDVGRRRNQAMSTTLVPRRRDTELSARQRPRWVDLCLSHIRCNQRLIEVCVGPGSARSRPCQRTAQCPIRGMTRPARGLGTRIDERNPEKLRA